MNIPLFEELGLSPNEAKIYDALISFGGSGVSTISIRSKLHRSNAYDSLHRLIEKGLVYEVLGQRETVYEAIDPHKLRELLEEKVQKLDGAMPAIMKTFQHNLSAERAYIFKGIEGMKNYMRLALKEGKDLYTLGGKGGWLDPKIRSFSESFLKECKRKKMTMRYIFDEALNDASPEMFDTFDAEYKLLPKKYYSTSAIDIFGDHIVTFTGMTVGKLSDDLTIFVIVSRELAESYRTWWQYVWDTLPAPRKGPRSKKQDPNNRR